MLWFQGPIRPLSSRASRRDVLQVGSLAMAGGISLANVLRAQASSPVSRPKSVIMIWMRGGPSHIDSFDMKPDAPIEVRGEFQPISTNVPGISICEYMPFLSQSVDKFAIIRGIRSNDLGDHTPHYIITGSPDRGKRPAFGAVVSKLESSPRELPPYVSLMYDPPKLYDNEGPVYLGHSHRPFVPREQGLANLTPPRGIEFGQLQDRKQLLSTFDNLQRKFGRIESTAALDTFTARALRMVSSSRARDAFDLSKEAQATRERYGKYCEGFLMARRLAEAGISVITLKVGDWDTHEKNFIDMRQQLPLLDRGFHALLSDLYERGIADDVAVVLWGEFGRAPRISRGDGRDHWPQAGTAVVAGGGFKTGQVIGETDSHGGEAKNKAYTPGNVMANLYRHLGIDPSRKFLDQNQRAIPILDDCDGVSELT